MRYIDLLATATLSILTLEVFLRLTFQQRSENPARGFRSAMLDVARQLELFSATEPHPFLQFTRPRPQLADGDQEYGFHAIRLSDVPKPTGVVRIACIGGRSTERGYPDFLQAYLNDAAHSQEFEVLNFAVDGWASVHSMLNFILNVREFHPDIAIVHDELRGAVCGGYPCQCRGRIHDYTPLPFRDNPLDEWMLRTSWIYRACKVLIARDRQAFDSDGRELEQYRCNLQTICTVAACDGIKVILLTLPCATDDGSHHDATRAVNESIRKIANERRLALVELENLSDADKTDNRITAERIGKRIIAMQSGSDAR